MWISLNDSNENRETKYKGNNKKKNQHQHYEKVRVTLFIVWILFESYVYRSRKKVLPLFWMMELLCVFNWFIRRKDDLCVSYKLLDIFSMVYEFLMNLCSILLGFYSLFFSVFCFLFAFSICLYLYGNLIANSQLCSLE